MDFSINSERLTIRLGSLPRITTFPLQVRALGYVKNNWHNDRRETLSVVFGVTLSSHDDVILRMVNGKKVEKRCPSMGFLYPGDFFQNLSPKPWSEFYFSYPPSALRILKDFGIKLPESHASITITPTFKKNLWEILQLAQKPYESGNADKIDNACFYFMRECLIKAETPEHDSLMNSVVKDALSWMQVNSRDPFDIKAFLKKRGMSYRTFLRKWNASMSKSPSRFSLDLRLAEAQQLLEETSLNIKEIASELHFVDQFYFSRQFRRHTGMSPRQYRTSHAGNPLSTQ